MLNKKLVKILGLIFGIILISNHCIASQTNRTSTRTSTNSKNKVLDLSNYDTSGTLFQKIVDLEQQKLLLKLEKEQTQMELDLKKLQADKLAFQREQDKINQNQDFEKRKAEESQKKLEEEKKKLEEEKKYIEEQKSSINKSLADIASKQKTLNSKPASPVVVSSNSGKENISSSYRIKDILGAGGMYSVVLEGIPNNQVRKLSKGQMLPNGYKITKIQPIEGKVTFEKDDDVQELSI